MYEPTLQFVVDDDGEDSHHPTAARRDQGLRSCFAQVSPWEP